MFRTFRVRKSAASLKPIALNCLVRLRNYFPRSKERGLIEAFLAGGFSNSDPAFPRSKERGLIEAYMQTTQRRTRKTFPRSKERGLIEACMISRLRDVLRPFRVRKSAASLKLLRRR